MIITVLYFHSKTNICHINTGDNYEKYFLVNKELINKNLIKSDLIVTVQSESQIFPQWIIDLYDDKVFNLDALHYLNLIDQKEDSVLNEIIDQYQQIEALSADNNIESKIFDSLYRTWIYVTKLYASRPENLKDTLTICSNPDNPFYKITYINNYLKQAIFNVRYFNSNKIKINDKLVNYLYKPSYSALKHKLGRLTCADDIYLNIEYRNKILPNNDNILELDASAAELQFLVHHIQNKSYDTKIDIYDFVANNMGIQKSHVKSSILPYYYGSKISSIHSRTKISEEIISSILAKFVELFPDVKTFIDERTPLKDHYVIDTFGKRIVIEQDKKHSWLNYFCQSSFSMQFQTYINKLIKAFQEQGFKSNILFTIHDSVYIDVLYSELEQIVQTIKNTNSFGYKLKRKFLHEL